MTRPPQNVLERFLAHTPKADNRWLCPWFIVLSIGCMFAILSGVLALAYLGSVVGLVYALLGGGLWSWQIGRRQSHHPSP